MPSVRGAVGSKQWGEVERRRGGWRGGGGEKERESRERGSREEEEEEESRLMMRMPHCLLPSFLPSLPLTFCFIFLMALDLSRSIQILISLTLSMLFLFVFVSLTLSPISGDWLTGSSLRLGPPIAIHRPRGSFDCSEGDDDDNDDDDDSHPPLTLLYALHFTCSRLLYTFIHCR